MKILIVLFSIVFLSYANAQEFTSNRSELQTAICDGLNNALTESGWSCSCQRKGRFVITGKTIQQPDIEFKCKPPKDAPVVADPVVIETPVATECPQPAKTVTMISVVDTLQPRYCFMPPPTYDDLKTPLVQSDILGYSCKTVMKDGSESNWSDVSQAQ